MARIDPRIRCGSVPPREDAAARTLYLLRHAKSSWDDPTLADRDRPLAPRGLRAGKAIASWVSAHGVAPDLVLCSPATRTRETLELVAAGFPAERPPRVAYEAGIYGGSAAELLAILGRAPGPDRSVMLVGHQPAMQDLALLLVGEEGGRERLEGKFPTGALATLEVRVPWPELTAGCARLAAYVKPRELERATD